MLFTIKRSIPKTLFLSLLISFAFVTNGICAGELDFFIEEGESIVHNESLTPLQKYENLITLREQVVQKAAQEKVKKSEISQCLKALNALINKTHNNLSSLQKAGLALKGNKLRLGVVITALLVGGTLAYRHSVAKTEEKKQRFDEQETTLLSRVNDELYVPLLYKLQEYTAEDSDSLEKWVDFTAELSTLQSQVLSKQGISSESFQEQLEGLKGRLGKEVAAAKVRKEARDKLAQSQKVEGCMSKLIDLIKQAPGEKIPEWNRLFQKVGDQEPLIAWPTGLGRDWILTELAKKADDLTKKTYRYKAVVAALKGEPEPVTASSSSSSATLAEDQRKAADDLAIANKEKQAAYNEGCSKLSELNNLLKKVQDMNKKTPLTQLKAEVDQLRADIYSPSFGKGNLPGILERYERIKEGLAVEQKARQEELNKTCYPEALNGFAGDFFKLDDEHRIKVIQTAPRLHLLKIFMNGKAGFSESFKNISVGCHEASEKRFMPDALKGDRKALCLLSYPKQKEVLEVIDSKTDWSKPNEGDAIANLVLTPDEHQDLELFDDASKKVYWELRKKYNQFVHNVWQASLGDWKNFKALPVATQEQFLTQGIMVAVTNAVELRNAKKETYKPKKEFMKEWPEKPDFNTLEPSIQKAIKDQLGS